MSSFDFKFQLPLETWEDQTVYAFRGPKVGEVEHLLLLALDRTLMQGTIAEFAKAKIDGIVENLQSLEVLKSTDITVPGGNPTYEFVAKWTLADKLTKYKRYIFTMSDEIGFTFNCDFTHKTFQMLGPEMDQVVESLVPGTFGPNADAATAAVPQWAQ